MIYCQKNRVYQELKNILKEIWHCIGVLKSVKSRHGIGIPTTYGYQHYGEKIGFYVSAMFDQS